MMEDKGWKEVRPGIYSSNNNTSATSSETQAQIDSVKARLQKELEAFKAAKSAQRAIVAGRR